MARAEWAGRTARPFIEAAEVLGIDTDLVMAAMETDTGTMHVLFSPTREEATSKVLATTLRRDEDGVLYVAVTPREMPGLIEEIKRNISEGR